MFPQTIFLIGFMGSGKTTIGKKLASKLRLQFVDLDEEIIKSEVRSEKSAEINESVQLTIEKIVTEKGFDYFRKLESKILKDLPLEGMLISTGGGTPCFFDNMAWMKKNGIVIFIDVDEVVLYSRLKETDLSIRPMLEGLSAHELKRFVHLKLKERMPFYQRAHLVFNPLKYKLDNFVKDLAL